MLDQYSIIKVLWADTLLIVGLGCAYSPRFAPLIAVVAIASAAYATVAIVKGQK